METHYSIREIAHLTGLSAHTLRYYERIGLIDPIARQPSGLRCYTERDLAWIQIGVRLRATGMPIAQMQEFAQLRRQGDSTVAARRTLLEAHRCSVVAEIAALTQHLEVIDTKIAGYDAILNHLGTPNQTPLHNNPV